MSKRVLERGTKLEGNAVSVDEPSTAAGEESKADLSGHNIAQSEIMNACILIYVWLRHKDFEIFKILFSKFYFICLTLVHDVHRF